MRFFKFYFTVLFLIVLICELKYGYWLNSNPFHIIKTTYKDNNYIFYNKIHSGDKKIKYNLNKFGMRYNSNKINDLFMISFGSGIVLQSTITEGKTILDYLKKDINIKIANYGNDGHSTSGILKTLNLLKKTNLSADYFMFIIGANEGSIDNNYINRSLRLWNSENKVFIFLNKNSFFFKKLIEAFRNLKLLITNKNYYIQLFKSNMISYDPILDKNNYLKKNYTLMDYNLVSQALKKQQHLTNNNLLEITKVVKKNFKSKVIFVTIPHAYGYKKNDDVFVYNKVLDYDDEIKLIKSNSINYKNFIQFNYLRNKVISDRIMQHCEMIAESICINGFENINLDVGDFHDGFHLNEMGSKKVGEYLVNKLKNEIY
jgi:lysophospholipase L1-like esterase